MSDTYFIDIDGTILWHFENGLHEIYKQEAKVLDGVIDFFNQLEAEGAMIILTTARPECLRAKTIDDLEYLGIFYHQLVMNCGHGKRVLMNDFKLDGPYKAQSINVPRNHGLEYLVKKS